MTKRLVTLAFFLVLVGEAPHALLSARSRFDPDVWTRTKVDALVRAARKAYQDEDAEAAYHRVLTSIVRTIQRRKLLDDQTFSGRYREFVEYVQAASLDQLPGHELGFAVPDKQYFEETRQYVQIPGFLMSQNFLRLVSRYETLERAKVFLRELNS